MGLGPNSDPQSPVSISCYASKMGGEQCSQPCLSNMDMHEKMTPRVYKGHINSKTVKDVTLLGPKGEYVASGSACGQIFIWRKKDGKLIHVTKTDNKHLADCIESHPHTMVLASSGFDHDIKIWTPKAFEKANLPKNIEQLLLFHSLKCWPNGMANIRDCFPPLMQKHDQLKQKKQIQGRG